VVDVPVVDGAIALAGGPIAVPLIPAKAANRAPTPTLDIKQKKIDDTARRPVPPPPTT
jgi:hypothetical protein